MFLNCTNGVFILFFLFFCPCISQDFYRILQDVASMNLTKNMKKLIFYCFLLLGLLVMYFPRLAAQNITFKHLSTDNGLSQISVNDIYVDENNLIWIGTREGLNCYDGNAITIYRLEKNNPYSLFSNHVLRITGDQKGHLYLLCMGGVASFDMDTRRFTTLLSGKVDAIAYRNGLYVACGSEIFRYNEQTSNFDSYYRLSSEEGNISSLFQDKAGRFWIGTDHDGLYCLSGGGSLSHVIRSQRISSVYEDVSHRIWVGTWNNGIFLLDQKGNIRNIRAEAHSMQTLSSNFVRCFEEDNKGCMWIGTEAGLDCMDLQTGAITHYTEGEQPYGLTHSSVWCIRKDAQGTIWAGTYFGGVNYFNPEYAIYRFFRQADTPAKGLSSPVVGNMIEDKRGNIWICTEGGGLNVFDPVKNTFQWYTHRPSVNSISHNNVKAIWYDEAADCMWLGLHLGGINKLDIKTGRFFVYRKVEGDKESIPSDIVRDIVPYKDSLVVATQSGVCLFSRATGKCRQLFQSHKEGKLIRMVADLEFDKNGVLWMAVTGEGAFSYDFKTNALTHYMHRKGEPGISNNNVNSIFCDSENKIWFCTSGSGLDCLDPQTGTFRNYDVSNSGFSSDCIYKVCEGDQKELLMITNQGFSCFDYRKGTIRNYWSGNGFPLNSVNENALFLSKKKEVFLGGTSGMVMFSLNSLNYRPKPYHIMWTRLVVNGKEIGVNDASGILSHELNHTSCITLKADQNMFSIYFSTSNYIPENREQMEYLLEGFSKEWTKVREQPVITYTNLNSGTYTLWVRSANPDSLSKPIRMQIVVKPPFYASEWAFLLYVLLVGGIVFYLMRMYQSRVKLQASLTYEQRHLQDIERLNQNKLRFFTSISHEFRTPLTLILGQLEKLMQMPQLSPSMYSTVLLAYKSGMQLKELIGELLDFRKQEQGKMKLKVSRMNLVNFLNETYLLFQPYAESKQIHFEFHKSQDDIELWFDWKQMRKVINNLLSNAMKHVPSQGKIVMEVGVTDTEAWFSVEDNGSGILPADIDKIFDRFYQSSADTEINAGTGIGLALTKGIVELHHGKISVESTKGEGAKFTVRIPLGKDLYDPDEIIEATDGAIISQLTLDEQKKELATELSDEKDASVEGLVGGKDGFRPRILIVEDNASIRRMLAELFEGLYEVTTAVDGQDALEKVAEVSPHIVLSDVLMPRMSGIELVKQLKGNLDTCHIPVVLLTARTEIEQNLEGLKIGADDYITKPFDSRLLVFRCNNLVNNRRKLQEYFTKQPTVETPVLATNPLDKEFLDEVIAVFEQHLDDSDFTIDMLAQKMLVSRTRMYAKIKAITGQTPNDFFITLRLKKAAFLLRNNPELNVTQISDQTGFSSPRYFSKLFKKAYQLTPMAYRQGEEQ